MSAHAERRLSGAQLRLRMRHPFFATLALFAPVRFTASIDSAATDGERLFFNPDFLEALSDPELDGLMTHEVLHAALLHPLRRGRRNPELWNIACDIVVNGMTRAAGLVLPEGVVEHEPWAQLSAEEIYHRLLKNAPRRSWKIRLVDLIEPGQTPDGAAGGRNRDTPLDQRQRAAMAARWRAALNQARIMGARRAASGKGSCNAGRGLEWDAVTEQQLDWRTLLWRHLVRTPTDYAGFDRRFIGRGLYLDALEGECVETAVCVDTSGSIGPDELNQFLSEITGILGAYPHIHCHLFFCDTRLHGPYELAQHETPPRPTGGGGTSFKPFFRWLKKNPPLHGNSERLVVYLTDGYGDFPREAPPDHVLWVVIDDGLESGGFPFGEVTRLLLE